jgi:hypothetical protein
MPSYSASGSINSGLYNFFVDGVGITHDVGADLAVESNLTVLQFIFEPAVSSLTADSDFVKYADADLSSDGAFVFGVIFEGDIVESQNFTSEFSVDATGVRISEGVASLVNSPLRSRFAINIQDVQQIFSYTVDADATFTQIAYPFTTFVDADAGLTATFASLTEPTVVENANQNTFAATATLDVVEEFIDGTTRKFTNNQIGVIASNRARIVDWVEIYPNFQDPDLPNATTQDLLDVIDNTATASDFQWPMQPVYRFNSSARDLDLVDYRGNTFNYKGKNVLFNLPSFNYDYIFNKKTMKVSLNGLLLHFQYAGVLERLNGARIVMGKAVFESSNTTQGVSSAVAGEQLSMTMTQVDNAVLLMRGVVNSVIFSGNSSDNQTVMEISHGFYEFDKTVGVQPNRANYSAYLQRTGYNDPNLATSRMGVEVTDNVLWGLTRA